MKYAVQVIYGDGEHAFLRHGAEIGKGPVVQFRTKREAEQSRAMVEMGLDLDDGARAVVILYGAPDVEAERLA